MTYLIFCNKNTAPSSKAMANTKILGVLQKPICSPGAPQTAKVWELLSYATEI
jgi:hypothetical protein